MNELIQQCRSMLSPMGTGSLLKDEFSSSFALFFTAYLLFCLPSWNDATKASSSDVGPLAYTSKNLEL